MRWTGFLPAARVIARAGGSALIALAATVALVSAASAQTDESQWYLDVLVETTPESGQEWELEVASSQPGCPAAQLTAGAGTPTEKATVSLSRSDESGQPCSYAITALNLPTGFRQLATPPVTFEPSEIGTMPLYIVDTLARGSITVLVETPASLDETLLPDVWEFEISSPQPGCTNRTDVFPNDRPDPATMAVISETVAVALERWEGEVDDIVYATDESACPYTIALTNLPTGWASPEASSFSPSDPGRPAYFTAYPTDVRATVTVFKEVNGAAAVVPATWNIGLGSEQAGCSNDELQLTSMNLDRVEGRFVDVAPNDANGEPCSYVITEANLPDGWHPAPPVEVRMVDPLSGYAVLVNNHLESAQATVSVQVVSVGDLALVPEFLNYEFMSPCLAEPVVLAIAAADTIVGSGDARKVPAESFEVPMFDANGDPCTFLVDEPAYFSGFPDQSFSGSTQFEFTLDPQFSERGFFFDYRFGLVPPAVRPSGVRIAVYTNAEEAPPTWTYELASPQPGCTNRTFAFEETAGSSGLINWVDDAGDWCVYTLSAIDVPPNLIPPESQVFRFPQLGELRRLTFLYLDLTGSDSINFTAYLMPAAEIPETLTFELTASQPGCTNRTVVVSDDVSIVNPVEIDDVAALDETGDFCRYNIRHADLPDGWQTDGGPSDGAASFTFAPDHFGRVPSTPILVSYAEESSPTVLVAKRVDGDLDTLPATWDFELTSRQAGCSSDLLSIPSDGSALVRGAFVDVHVNDLGGNRCRYAVTEVNLPDGWVQPSPVLVDYLSDRLSIAEFTNTDFASAVFTLDLFVRSFGDPELAPEYWEFEVTSACLAEPVVITLPSQVTFDDDFRRDSPQRVYIDLPALDPQGDECEHQVEFARSAAFSGGFPQFASARGGPHLDFVSFLLVRRGDESPADVSEPYVSQPVDNEPYPSVPYPSEPADTPATGAPIAASPSATAVVLPAPSAPLPVMTAVPAPTSVVSGATYGFTNSLPTKHAAPQLAVTGANTKPLTNTAVMLLLAGVALVAVARAPKPGRGEVLGG